MMSAPTKPNNSRGWHQIQGIEVKRVFGCATKMPQSYNTAELQNSELYPSYRYQQGPKHLTLYTGTATSIRSLEMLLVLTG